jgi:hypothetical protein
MQFKIKICYFTTQNVYIKSIFIKLYKYVPKLIYQQEK